MPCRYTHCYLFLHTCLFRLLTALAVVGGAHQAVKFRRIRKFHLDNLIGESVAVHQFRLVFEFCIDLDHLTANG